MKDKFFINILMAFSIGLFCVTAVLMKAFSLLPPKLSIPNMVLISVIALSAERFFVKDIKRAIWENIILSGIIFALFSFFAGILETSILKMFVLGAFVFATVDLIFSSALKRRISLSNATIIADAILIFLASQIFNGLP